ncbi:MAG: hypothetical protein DMG06_22425 [Acidobacteria bacterium]|nr:MAG: hypothetical protein DMG06_22425 [Acidobacteriota bacterium]
MTRTMAHNGGNRIRAASYLLLVLLASNLFHSHPHGFDLRDTGAWPWTQKTLLKPSAEGTSSTYDRIPACLVCNCQKQKIAVLSTQALLAKLVQIDHCSIEPVQPFKKQPFLPIDLSRAPPLLG